MEGRQGRSRPKLTWNQEIQADLRISGIDGTTAQERRTWRAVIRQPGTGRIRTTVDLYTDPRDFFQLFVSRHTMSMA